MSTSFQPTHDLAGVPSHERHFYDSARAFGRFGMRVFKPTPMSAAHWHGHIEVNFSTDADLEYDLDGQTLTLPEGHMAIFWAGVPHQLTTIHPTGSATPKLCNMYVPLDSFLLMRHIGQLQVDLLGGGFAVLPTALCDAARMEIWYEDYRSRDFERVSLIKDELNAMLRRAQVSQIDWLREPGAETPGERIIPTAHIRHVVEMVRFILENLSEPMTNADVARVTGLHENYALSLFTRTMRLPMKRFIIRMRLLRARAFLLESSAAISTVAVDSGFSSLSQFYDHFKKAYGMSPHMMRFRYSTMTLR